jgi:hypothetical protein
MLHKAQDKVNGVLVGIGTKQELDAILVHYLAETRGAMDDIVWTEPTAEEINAEIEAGGLRRAT